MITILMAMLASVTPAGPIPIGSPGKWLTSDDYPVQSLRNHDEDDVFFRLVVEPDGKPQDCTVTGSKHYPELDAISCLRLMQRAHFKPALDQAGMPIASIFSSAIHFSFNMGKKASTPNMVYQVNRLPEGVDPRVDVIVIAEVGGHVSACVPKTEDAANPLAAVACQQLKSGWTPLPVKDGSGAEVRSLQTVTVGFEAGPSRPPN